MIMARSLCALTVIYRRSVSTGTDPLHNRELCITIRSRPKPSPTPSKEAQGEAEIATKRDIERLEAKLDTRFERIDGELRLNRWMLGLMLAGVVSLILKAFF